MFILLISNTLYLKLYKLFHWESFPWRLFLYFLIHMLCCLSGHSEAWFFYKFNFVKVKTTFEIVSTLLNLSKENSPWQPCGTEYAYCATSLLELLHKTKFWIHLFILHCHCLSSCFLIFLKYHKVSSQQTYLRCPQYQQWSYCLQKEKVYLKDERYWNYLQKEQFRLNL